MRPMDLVAFGLTITEQRKQLHEDGINGIVGTTIYHS